MKARLFGLLFTALTVIACTDASSGGGGGPDTAPVSDTVVADRDTVSTDALSTPETTDTAAPYDVEEWVKDDTSNPWDIEVSPVDPEASIHRILWVGNSFTFFNDLDQLWKSLLEANGPVGTIESLRAASAGYRWVQHLAEATADAGTAPIREWLVTAPPQWDLVVLQEQSQIPGFPPGNPEHDASVAAAVSLAQLVAATGGRPVLFETWGYRAGDAQNGELFPDYVAMQDRLDEGFDEIAGAIAASSGAPLRLRAGAAFRMVHDAFVAASVDPLDPSSLFSRLYTEDGRHPSLLGSYLTACVLAATLSPTGSVGVDWAPPGLDPWEAARLREAAEATVKANPR